MNKILLKIKENWNDPVWSIVIATIIISVGGSILAMLYSFALSLYYSISFSEAFGVITTFLNETVEIKIWLFLFLLVTYFMLVFTPFMELAKNIKLKVKTYYNSSKVGKQELPSAPSHSTPFFNHRMASAFPGIRELTWFENPTEATKRLEILLRKPIKFDPVNSKLESRPIWWFRGGRALYIEEFKKIGRRKVLMNHNQLKIKRIAAYQSASYYKDFVYVEVVGEKQTGLYSLEEDDIKRHIDTYGYSREEYGIIKNKIGWQIPIRREDYDDGATVINGKVRNAMDAKLRSRYLTDYNFIIAAKGSPYNSTRFDKESLSIFNRILKNEIEPSVLFDFLKGFEKHEGKLI